MRPAGLAPRLLAFALLALAVLATVAGADVQNISDSVPDVQEVRSMVKWLLWIAELFPLGVAAGAAVMWLLSQMHVLPFDTSGRGFDRIILEALAIFVLFTYNLHTALVPGQDEINVCSLAHSGAILTRLIFMLLCGG